MFFLEQVAEILYRRYGNNLRDHATVFPNRRGGLFFLKYLSKAAGKPLWAPSVMTISDFFGQFSTLDIADSERLVFELFRNYIKITGSKESFDSFYYWGEQVVGDFDDVDRHMVDAGSLFSNLADLHDIGEAFGGLEPDKVEIVRQFIINFRQGSDSGEKQRFEQTWSLLYKLYTTYRESLRASAIAYEGMLYRDIASMEGDELMALTDRYEKIHFIGFNALNRAEEIVMKRLQDGGRALFYWDYSERAPYIDSFDSLANIRSAIKLFGQERELAESIGESYSNSRHITIVDSPSDTGQAKTIPFLLEQIRSEMLSSAQERTAVILADETLLMPVLSSVPPFVTDLNVTMGYPFGVTVLYSFIRSLLQLRENPVTRGATIFFDKKRVNQVITNPLVAEVAGDYIRSVNERISKPGTTLFPAKMLQEGELLSHIFDPPSSASDLSRWLRTSLELLMESNSTPDGDISPEERRSGVALTAEFIFVAQAALNRLDPLLADSDISITGEVYIRLVEKVLREIKVPFSGEPLSGIQVMGLLESRSLDFDNIILLSANEGVLPRSAISSYIPFSLREAFGMPLPRYEDSVYGYHFSRLLQRAKRVTLLYNSSSDGLRSGEMSRYLLRLRYMQGGDTILFRTLSSAPVVSGSVPEKRERGPEETEILRDKYLESATPLSPSAIITWINCKMQFYYKYICRFRESESDPGAFDASLVGSLLHELIGKIYNPYRGREVSRSDLVRLIGSLRSGTSFVTENIVSMGYASSADAITGNLLLMSDIVALYLKRVLMIDSRMAPFRIVSLEESYDGQVSFIDHNGIVRPLTIGGRIDRIDSRSGVVRIIDYKTGRSEAGIKSLDDLFGNGVKKVNSPFLQILIYCAVVDGKPGFEHIRPVIYGLRGVRDDSYDDNITIGKEVIETFASVRDQFMPLLSGVLSEMFDPATPFEMTGERDRCRYCRFIELCNR